jgi:branched-chain amino acid transport system permease protein
MLFNGLQLGSVYVLTALGFTLIFGILHIVNMAQGSIYMLGGYVIWLSFSILKMNYFISLLLTIVIVGLLGLVIERFLFRRLQGLMMSTVIFSIGLMQFLEAGALVVFGIDDQYVASPFSGMLRLWGTAFSIERLAIILIGIGLTTALVFWVKKSKDGLALRAVAQDREAASLHGISFNRYGALAFGIGCGLTGAAGALVAPMFYINPFMGHGALFKLFIIVVIGGLGSVPGTIAAGLLFGLIDSFVTTLFNSDVASIWGFMMIILMLIFKPTGLFGHE